jgi:hypothetical protein
MLDELVFQIRTPKLPNTPPRRYVELHGEGGGIRIVTVDTVNAAGM